MDTILVGIIFSLIALALLVALFGFLGLRWHAITAAAVVYLIAGGFVATAQAYGGGGCESWRTDGYWRPIVDWPGDIYDNVIEGGISFRRYLIPQTCEMQQPT